MTQVRYTRNLAEHSTYWIAWDDGVPNVDKLLGVHMTSDWSSEHRRAGIAAKPDVIKIMKVGLPFSFLVNRNNLNARFFLGHDITQLRDVKNEAESGLSRERLMCS